MPFNAIKYLVGIAGLCVADGSRIASRKTVEAVKARSTGNFACPYGCQECCIDANFFGFAQKDDFKCIAKLPQTIYDSHGKGGFDSTTDMDFDGRTCDPPDRRTHAPEQGKLDCEYTQEEIDAKAWTTLSEPCSKYSKCCCDSQEDWTEDKCLAMDMTSPEATAESSRGSTEKYLRQQQTYLNTDGACVNLEYHAHMYQTDVEHRPTDQGCCFHTEVKSKEERYMCGCSSSGSGNSCSSSESWCTRTVYWVACAEFETLYHCSDNDGLTQSGQKYNRVSSQKGMCVGDQSSFERLMRAHDAEFMDKYKNSGDLKLNSGKCPSGFKSTIAGQKCDCEFACGEGY